MIGESREEIGPQLETALSILEHYHSEHTNDKITRFVNKECGVCIYISKDPEWVRKFAAFTAEEFPEK